MISREEIEVRAWVLRNFFWPLEDVQSGKARGKIDGITAYLLRFDPASRAILQSIVRSQGKGFLDFPEIEVFAEICGLRPGAPLPHHNPLAYENIVGKPAEYRLEPVSDVAAIPHADQLADDDLASNYTFALIKSHAIWGGIGAAIIADVRRAGFEIFLIRHIRPLPCPVAHFLYHEHRKKPYFDDLLGSVCGQSGVIAMLLKCPGAVEAWRNLCGATDPEQAAPGTLRQRYGTKLPNNAVHGSDSAAAVRREASAVFEQAALPRCLKELS